MSSMASLVAANRAGSDLTEMIIEYTREAQTGRKLLKTLINGHEAEWLLKMSCQAINRLFGANAEGKAHCCSRAGTFKQRDLKPVKLEWRLF